MPARNSPSEADQELIGFAAAGGATVTPKQLRIWRERGLLAPNVVQRLGRGRGTTSRPATDAHEMTLWLAQHAAPGRRPGDLALLAFADGKPVSEPAVRAAFRAAVDSIKVKGEPADAAAQAGDPREQAEAAAQRVIETGRPGLMVPARVRRLDEASRNLGIDLTAPELARLDPESGTLDKPRAADLVTTAADVMFLGAGGVDNQAVADFFRALSPAGAANPLASFIALSDLEGEGAAVQDVDGVLPDGDLRDELRAVAEQAPLALLHAAWRCADQTREWAEELCARAEAEAAAGQAGPATVEWCRASLTLSRLFLVSALKPTPPSPADHARTAVELVMIYQMLRRLDAAIPGLQWDVLALPHLMPDCVRAFVAPAATSHDDVEETP